LKLSDIQRGSQAVLDSIQDNDFHGAFEAWKKRWDRCICPKETILKEMAAKIKLNQYLFFNLVRELSDTPRINKLITKDRKINKMNTILLCHIKSILHEETCQYILS
jgi:acid phosphatase class B